MERGGPRQGCPFSYIGRVNASPLARLTVRLARFAVTALGRKLPARFSAAPGGIDAGIFEDLVRRVRCSHAPARWPPSRSPAAAQGSYSPYNETAAAALARYVRALAEDPKDFQSLIGAGRAALELGDTQAAAGFFARADEVDPRSPLAAGGHGRGLGRERRCQGGDALFHPRPAARRDAGDARLRSRPRLRSPRPAGQRAGRLSRGAERSRWREARRRLALSLAISGDKAGAIATLAPLSAKGDTASPRVRAFVLALTGDSKAAMTAINAAMPGSCVQRRAIPPAPAVACPRAQKAAAVNLGIFPDSNAAASLTLMRRRSQHRADDRRDEPDA